MVMDITDENVNGYNVRAPHEVQVRPSRRARPTGSRERGFEWMPRLGQFRKRTYRGFSNLLLSFSNYADGVMVEGHCGIRIDAVEDTVYQYTNGFREFQPNSHTLITSTGRLEGELTRRRLVESREDAVETALGDLCNRRRKG